MHASRFTTLAASAAATLFALALGGCQSVPDAPDNPDEVPTALATAQALADAGDNERALALLRKSREVRGADPASRDALEVLLIEVAARRLEELEQARDADELLELTELNLPRQLAVRAGLLAARIELEDDDPKAAVKIVRQLDGQFPFHHEREEAGSILWDAGTLMAADDEGWTWFTLRDNGRDALEYLCDQYIRDARWDRAAFLVAELYEDEEEWEIAREWHEDLLTFRPASPLVVSSLARIPRLRLNEIESPEYDRTQVEVARDELEQWLSQHSDHPSGDEARADYADALRRLVLSDLVISKFYERNDKTFGARYHLDRAIATAEQIEDEALDVEIAEVSQRVEDLENGRPE